MNTAAFSDDGIEELEYTCGSDYSGDTVARSNYETLLKELGDTPGFYALYGDYSSYGIGYVESELDDDGKERLKDILDRLSDYPSLDDDRLSAIEETIKAEYWESEGKILLRAYIADSEDLADLPEKFMLHALEVFYDNCIIETGQLAYCDSDRFSAEMNRRYPIQTVYYDGRYTIVSASRGLTTLFKVNEYAEVVANQYGLTPIGFSAEDLRQYAEDGVFDVISGKLVHD